MEKRIDSFFLSNKKEKAAEKEQTSNYNKSKQGETKDHSPTEKSNTQNITKKPFDKKKYRFKKYSNRYKLEQWEEQRKKKLLHKYHRDLKKEQPVGSYKPLKFDESDMDSSEEGIGKFVRHPDLLSTSNHDENNSIKSKNIFLKGKEKYNKMQQDKLRKQQEMQLAKEERKQKIQEYKKKKQERFKKLSKKTKKGQPIMTGRLELLLEKIQK